MNFDWCVNNLLNLRIIACIEKEAFLNRESPNIHKFNVVING